MNRRRSIILGASTLAGLLSCRDSSPLRSYTTIAFGTEVHFQLHGVSDSVFQRLSAECSLRLRELEAHFSLYDPASTISQLNRTGSLIDPPAEFLKLLRIALSFGEKTEGLFDVSVQPLWEWRQRWKEANLEKRSTMYSDSWEETLSLVDFRKITATEKTISFSEPGMAITLNGIAQGYATDDIKSLLQRSGIRHTLVNIGEYAALGTSQGGNPWQVELAANGEQFPLPSGRALAVSAGSGYTFEPEGRLHHIFRPTDGVNTRPDSSIIVTAPTATEADALSTTFTVASGKQRRNILRHFPDADFREIK